MGEWAHLEFSEFDRLKKSMEEYGAGAGQIVDDVLHGEGAEDIKARIAPLIPASGRKWRGKRTAASIAMPGHFSQDNYPQGVVIAARGSYHYLYFPDDGANTHRHAGNQQFMLRGAELAAEKVIDRCVGKLIENFDKSIGG